MGFDAKLIEVRVVKATEFRRQTAEHPDQRELCCNYVNDKAEPRLLGEREAMFGFSLHLRKQLASEEEVRVALQAGVGSVREVSDPVRGFEGAAQHTKACAYVFPPAQHVNREAMVGARLEALQPASRNEFVAKLAELKSGLMVAEARSRGPAEHYIGDT